MSSSEIAGPITNTCVVCGVDRNLSRCGRCKITFYCSKDHQKQDWKKHKVTCKKQASADSVENKYGHIVSSQKCASLPSEGSFENEILNSSGEQLVINNNYEISSTAKSLKSLASPSAMPTVEDIGQSKPKTGKDFPDISLNTSARALRHNKLEDYLQEIGKIVAQDLTAYGLCVIDNFLGVEKGKTVLAEVLKMQSQGVFCDGQLVSSNGEDSKNIRSDKICWIHGKETNYPNIGHLVSQVDSVIMKANKLSTNSELGRCNINGRTKAMVACYPGSGARYVKHVDNPNRDGRCITGIYYLNLNWDVKTMGGLLRVFPQGWMRDKVADIEPIFDRLVFFWSDRRNPHEVQPSFNTRYAVTLWYFEATERREALKRFEREMILVLPTTQLSEKDSQLSEIIGECYDKSYFKEWVWHIRQNDMYYQL